MIRQATVGDITQILALGDKLKEQSPFVRTINPQKARKNLAFFISSKRCLVLVAEHQGEIVGFIVGGIEDNWYSDERTVTDVAFYVEPKYRVYAAGLVKHLRAWGSQFSTVSDFLLGISSGVDGTERTGRLYERLGMTRTGGMYAQILGAQDNE